MPSVTQGDLLVIRPDTKFNVEEVKEVINLVGDNAYVLYNYFRLATLYKDSFRITEVGISNAIGWPPYKVAKYRRVLEKANLIRIITVGNTNTITKLVVGIEAVTLFDAGLPHNIVDLTAFRNAVEDLGISHADIPKKFDLIKVTMAKGTKHVR